MTPAAAGPVPPRVAGIRRPLAGRDTFRRAAARAQRPAGRRAGPRRHVAARPRRAAVSGGNALPRGAAPVAQAYAGHQFGGFVPRLGDGRALLLGELADGEGRVRDIHLKGSGPTPFARGGDGLAAVGPMLREYIVSEAMHALGVPTTRSLAVVGTGRPVQRETPLPGAVLTRVASSHLRVGSFQYAASTGDTNLLRRLADHAIARHHPSAAAPNVRSSRSMKRWSPSRRRWSPGGC